MSKTLTAAMAAALSLGLATASVVPASSQVLLQFGTTDSAADQKAERIEERGDRRAARAAENGNYRKAARIDERTERRADRVDGRDDTGFGIIVPIN